MSVMPLKLNQDALAWHSRAFIICPSLSLQHEFSTIPLHAIFTTEKMNIKNHSALTNPPTGPPLFCVLSAKSLSPNLAHSWRPVQMLHPIGKLTHPATWQCPPPCASEINNDH